jgi:peptidyl-prolyl cis-trans isomerase A (cyclophilin A)
MTDGPMRTRLWNPASLIALTLLASCSRDRPATAAAATAERSVATYAGPATYRARFETSAGTFVIEVQRAWAPQGADRFYELVSSGYYDGQRFFRVLAGFMAQFGIAGDPKVAAAWRSRNILDDPVKQSNTRGMVSFATAGPNTRTTQVFINFGNNGSLDGMGFAPFGKVVEGMEVVDKLYADYGEGAPRGRGPDQGRIQSEGNAYLTKDFPKLDYIKHAGVVVAP